EDRALMWEIIQETPQGKETARYPEETTKTVWNKPLNYTFNPLNGCYSLNYRSPEPTMEEEPIGIYGLRWMEFMQKNYEIEVEVMMMDHKFRTVARRVDKEAEDYWMILDSQYEEENPRPETFEETLKWEEARKFYVDSSVMRDVVLKMRTE
ncbi:MAG: TnpV protein, partial [Oscillospiraceae bacterium]|nr:TnpV protein [Oscillospiraceae bacterium]